MASSLCGNSVGSRRALLAALWSLVTVLSALAFLTALTYTLSARNLYNSDASDDNYYNNNNNNNNQDKDENSDPEVAVTSRAMSFAAFWTAVLASLLTVFGCVVLGWQSPTGQYYTCCSSNVHRTTPLSLGSFIGALIMFANLTLVCSVLFGEFEIRDADYQREGQREGEDNNYNYSARDNAMERSSMAFSIMCMFLTVLYAGFAALTFSFSHSIIEEHEEDEREEALAAAHHHHHHSNKLTPHLAYNPHPTHHHTNGFNSNGFDGYIGERFDVHRSTRGPGPGGVGVGFVPNSGDVAALT